MGKFLSLCALVGFLTTTSVCVGNAEEIVANYSAEKFGKEVAKITYSLSINKNTRIERFDVTTEYKDSLTQKTRDTTDFYLRIVENKRNKYFANNEEIIMPEGYINPFQISDMLKNFTDTSSIKKNFKIRVDGNKEIGVSCEYLGSDSLQIEGGLKHHINIYKIKIDKSFKWKFFDINEFILYSNNIATMRGIIRAKWSILGWLGPAKDLGAINVNAKIDSLKINYTPSNQDDSTNTERP